jgi:hypothetical protein
MTAAELIARERTALGTAELVVGGALSPLSAMREVAGVRS